MVVNLTLETLNLIFLGASSVPVHSPLRSLAEAHAYAKAIGKAPPDNFNRKLFRTPHGPLPPGLDIKAQGVEAHNRCQGASEPLNPALARYLRIRVPLCFENGMRVDAEAVLVYDDRVLVFMDLRGRCLMVKKEQVFVEGLASSLTYLPHLQKPPSDRRVADIYKAMELACGGPLCFFPLPPNGGAPEEKTRGQAGRAGGQPGRAEGRGETTTDPFSPALPKQTAYFPQLFTLSSNPN